ncbi:calcium/sodium antiporter [Frigidibacter sp. ROC022]|uniref:calcium/sodium antiporter n=1 Tax=Frigidibacter sp. ROC022 TaxID=2971796 RepID=UPI00215A2347|nr:calcium/sodium antiporter [Frigidibacter sp. ROC022]MCR8724292.1 calcium/sodium antiporter [Frigidibacter sp. ROC022]
MSIVLGLLGGLVLLVLAGDALVRGAVALSLRLGIPALIVSLTVVAFGTSAPELVISVGAALKGASGIAVGNVVGSNIANVLLVLGVPALMAGLGRTKGDIRASFLMMMAATLLFGGLALNGSISRLDGLILLAGLAAMLAYSIHHARSARDIAALNAPVPPVEDLPVYRLVFYLLFGLVGLPVGAQIFVNSAVELARLYEIPEEIIGLTLVAIGTSLPELATTVMAAIRRQADVVLGNVIGSNLFNILGILGVTAVVTPLPVPGDILRFDFWVMLASALVLGALVYTSLRLTRPVGAVLTGLYVAYTLVLLA